MSDAEHEILHLDRGIPGLTDSERFLLSDLGDEPESAFQLLTSVDDPDVSIIVAIPWLFFPDYSPELPDAEQEALDISEPEQAIVFCPVTLDAEHEQIHLNLLGPFVVNAASRRGRQVVLADSEWPVRAAVELELS
ncbi:MAG: flagellar assembly protein FliW [Actinomycetota bacterium]